MIIAQSLIAVDSAHWEPVTVPATSATGQKFEVGQIIFDNSESGANDINRRIVETDANTQKLIPAGTQAIWTISDFSRRDRSTNLAPPSSGTIVAYLKSVSGSFNVAVEFIG